MTAVKKDLYMEQGATFTLGFWWYHDNPADPLVPGPAYVFDVNSSANMQIRASLDKPIIIEASTVNGKIVLGAAGRVDITLTPADTDLMTVGNGVYDLEIQLSPTDRRRILQGAVVCSLNVTRIDPVIP